MTARTITPAALLAVMMAAGCTQDRPGFEQRLTGPVEGFPQASVTIYPMAYSVTGPAEKHPEFYARMTGPPGRHYFDVIETLGLLLEAEGYDRFRLAEESFGFPEEKSARENRAESFGEFISARNLETDYALCTECTLHIERGFREVYSVMVDANGAVVWEDRQRPGNADFDRNTPLTPEKCCTLLRTRLAPVMRLDELAKKELSADKQRALHEMQAESPPDEPEPKAIHQRFRELKQAKGKISVLVCPTRINGQRIDIDSTERLSTLLNETGRFQATVSTTDPEIRGRGAPNQMKILWRYAHAVKDYTYQNPAGTDCVLFADYWIDSGRSAHGVHFILCDRRGDWIIVDLQNSHHRDFRRVDPKTIEDCDRLVLERLDDYVE